jgi:gliding motility-associated-like protein
MLDENQSQVYATNEYIASGSSVHVVCTPTGFDYGWSPMELLLNDNGNEATFVLSEDTWIEAEWMDGQCRVSDSVLVKVESVMCADPFIYVPNVFSPNNDGLHDAIGIQCAFPIEVFWMIRDRMGNEVFKTNVLEDSWNGTYKGVNAEPGVYHYYLKANCPNGEVWEKEGNITLMR